MLKPIAFANTAAAVGVAAFILCGILAFFVPDLLFSIASSWFHAINLESVRATAPMDFGTFLLGVVTFGIYVWILVYAGATFYNKWAQ